MSISISLSLKYFCLIDIMFGRKIEEDLMGINTTLNLFFVYLFYIVLMLKYLNIMI